MNNDLNEYINNKIINNGIDKENNKKSQFKNFVKGKDDNNK